MHTHLITHVRTHANLFIHICIHIERYYVYHISLCGYYWRIFASYACVHRYIADYLLTNRRVSKSDNFNIKIFTSNFKLFLCFRLFISLSAILHEKKLRQIVGLLYITFVYCICEKYLTYIYMEYIWNHKSKCIYVYVLWKIYIYCMRDFSNISPISIYFLIRGKLSCSLW